MATSNDKSTAEGESNTPPIPVPREHKALDYLLSQIPKKAQKGMLVQCDLDLLCVDADSEYIVLGSNVGTLFLYSRKREVMERLKTNSHNDLITAVRLHHGLEHQVVAGTSKGIVYIFQLPSSLPGQNKRLQMFVVKDMHKHKITCCVWSLNGMKVFTGDDSGVVVSTEFDAYQGQCKSSVTLVERDSQIIQLHHAHKALLVSTNHRSFIFRPDADDHIIQVGQKERKIVGDFGACFIPAMCKPDDASAVCVKTRNESVEGGHGWKSHQYIFVQRTPSKGPS
ncbi:hypothetical protein FSP39_013801 [Pinctada imbricata]|uniref:Uncharacterized protein n=1 Tax=Pinctada imbricata TaxID=66713 RepID=A0AA88XWP2_PINIB|nr:hypothetical protein FSP39_013801 [Pinctada imbricata]